MILRRELATLLLRADRLTPTKKKTVPKEQFLPILEFPNYEINGKLQIRDKSGKILQKNKSTGRIYLYRDGKRYERTPLMLWQRALTDNDTDTHWAKIMSLKGLYEINARGQVRNSKTKKLLTPRRRANSVWYEIKIGDKQMGIMVQNLLNECFGTNYPKRSGRVEIILRKNTCAYSFGTIKDAAKWLSPKIFLGIRRIRTLMSKRTPEIYGYKVSYFQKKSFKEIKL